MHIVIDGYNLIRQSDMLRRYEKISLEEGRKALVQRVSLYKKQRGHRITVIFDGWEGGSADEERDRQAGIDIIYSRRGVKADDVIKKIVQRGGDDLVVITSDRDIMHFTTRRGFTAISSPEFEEKMLSMGNHDGESGTMANRDEDTDDMKPGLKKKGPARRLSKARRQTLAKMQKL
ncbi:MAG: NYN domain-containing protein [Syntrophaceae bacterium]|nr:NYN domain-containing protein [Syntrophaceae bacterium]